MSTSEKKKRKFLLVLPILIFPFLTIIFWKLGGGSGSGDKGGDNLQMHLNATLPDGKADERAKDKFSYYEIAEKDSAELLELIKRDPNYQHPQLDSPYTDHDELYGYGSTNRYSDPTAERIYSGLNNLEREMQKPTSYGGGYGYDNYNGSSSYPSSGGYNSTSHDVSRLEQMMADLNQPASAPDPEMEQLNTMLDKIMEIQNPELANERLREKSAERRGEVFAVTTNREVDNISLLDDSDENTMGGGFFSLEEPEDEQGNTIKAVVHQDQTLVNGSTVKLRLVNDVFVNGIKIPKDNFIFGVAQLTGERLSVKIESIRYENSLFPVELMVYDMDGLDGIYIPGSITRDVAKQSADRPLQSISLSSIDPGWGAQAAGAGVELVKGVFSKQAKLIQVRVKAGYKLLLRDGKQRK